MARIAAIPQVHPFWRYRRVWAWLRYRQGEPVNKKRVYRLLRQAGLTQNQRPPHTALRTPRAKPKPASPRQYWGIDRTKFFLPSLGWVYLVVVLDWYTKKIVGFTVSPRARRQEWEAAVMMALQAEFPRGVRGAGFKLVSDNGTQPSSAAFMATMASLGIEQIFTSYDNPKGNADTERVMRTIKEELLWLQEFPNLPHAAKAIQHWIQLDYNQLYHHSALGDKSPLEFEASLSQPQPHAA